MPSPARRTPALVATALAALTALAGCSQSDSEPAAATSAAPAAPSSAAAAAPAPFDGAEPVEVAVVRQSGAGDYFESWGQGAQAQADAIGIELAVTDARNDNARHATDLEQAIAAAPDAIVVDHGQGDTVGPLVQEAVAAVRPGQIRASAAR